jgi:glucose/arabinose dehydrogenase
MKILAPVAALAAVGLLASAALCRFVVDCHLRGLPVISAFAHEPDVFEGLERRGTGATRLPPGFRQEVLARGLELPSAFAFLPGGEIAIAGKDGLVRLLADGRLRPRAFLDLRDRVDATGLRGLVAIEAHPEFDRNGWVYVQYMALSSAGPDEPTVVRLSRFTARTGIADPASERVLLESPLEGDHGGGTIAFLDDGSMLVSTGDGWDGSPGADPKPLRAQNLDSPAGKLLRLTDDGLGLPANPYWDGNPESVRSKVWAHGFRNPFRFTVEGEQVVLADVGWQTWEEIDIVERGGNYGWPCYEARERPSEYREHDVCRALYRRDATVRFPTFAYPNASVTGGTFLDSSLAEPYGGAYLYGDWAQSWLRFLPRRPDGTLGRTPRTFATQTGGPVQIERAPDGSIVYAALNAGELRRVSFGR